jgi:hypothetical protein
MTGFVEIRSSVGQACESGTVMLFIYLLLFICGVFKDAFSGTQNIQLRMRV